MEEILSGSSELIGNGLFGHVYKGLCVDGKAIVVKVLYKVCPCMSLLIQKKT